MNIRQICEQIAEAGTEGRKLVIRGAGSKPWMPVRLTSREPLSVGEYRGIISHDPSELVVTVRAGTPLEELESALAERGQMLPMEAPDFNGGSTIGGAVALGWMGSRGVFAGGIRDAVLGVRMINGLGEELRFGGQVMKNVAGFDVSRLLVGSCGELGVIAELSLRVLPRPPEELTLEWPCPELAVGRERVAGWLRQGFPVSAASVGEGRLRVRFSGAGAMLEELARTAGGEAGDSAFWRNLQTLALPLFHHGWGDEKLFDGNGEICWTAHTRRFGSGPAVSLSRGPDVSARGAVRLALHRRVAAAFDPAGLFRRDTLPGEGEAA